MTKTKWAIFAAICILTIGGLVFFARRDSVNVDQIDPNKAVSESASEIGDHVYGNKSSSVVIIEYGDFQCPGCGGAYPQLKTIKEEYKDKIAFIFRNFPLTTIHPNALAASTAAEAAGLQGKFWEMHDKLYENQDAWTSISASERSGIFIGYARDIGLDTTKFEQDLRDSRVSEKISRDRALGSRIGVNSTPTVYVNGQKLGDTETQDLIQSSGDKLKTKIDEALKKTQ